MLKNLTSKIKKMKHLVLLSNRGHTYVCAHIFQMNKGILCACKCQIQMYASAVSDTAGNTKILFREASYIS